MRSLKEISMLLDELDTKIADELENQDLDFKRWIFDSKEQSVKMVVDMAVCMANGGGGATVFGVNDNVVGRSRAISGVPAEIDINQLKKAVYDSTDPRLTPQFEELEVPEGTGRLLVMYVFPGLPPYTTTSGEGKIRVGKDCQPLTRTMRRRVMVETGETDFTAIEVPGDPTSHISASAVEYLRDVARASHTPEELLQINNIDFLESIGLLRKGCLTRSGLLLVGKRESIQEHLPGYVWTHLRMKDDTDYSDRMDGRDALPIALARLIDRIMADNPLTTIVYGPFHFEYRTYPEIALREALMNAFSHADYRIGGPILVKQYPSKLEISNPGGFIGGITPKNILHHHPVSRNPHLVNALSKLHLVNRSNLGISRMFKYMLIEGKEPPLIEEQGESVRVTLLSGDLSTTFRAFVEEESKIGRGLLVDQLLILQYLLRHAELSSIEAARICQRSEEQAHETLSEMELNRNYLERGGSGRGTYWILRSDLHRKLSASGHPERDRRIDWDAAKTRILSVLKQRFERGESGLSNTEIRQITHLGRYQVIRLMRELVDENPGKVELVGKGRGSRYIYCDG
jgi:ATP-dependent DNA helicase RecG